MSQAKVQAGLKFENLLVITDLSVESGAATPYARALASRYGSKVRVLHVIDPLPYVFGDPETARHKRREIWDAANTELSHWTAQFLYGTRATSTLVDGELGQAVLQAVRENAIDLLVLASHGATGLERMMVGSLGEEVFRGVPCPVMTIGPSVSKQPDQAARFERILFPTDLTPSSIGSIRYLASLAENCESAITLVHVADPGTQSPSERQRIRERVEEELRGLLPDEIKPRVRGVIVEFGPVAASIVEFALATKADVIVLGVKSGGSLTRGATHLPWAIAHQIIADAPCPVITIRGPAGPAET
jgi:nucleotide-binding universal stress UspA family protein